MPPESRFALSLAIPAWVTPVHIAIASGAVLLVSLPVTAQITPDNTLGAESSRVTGGVQVRGEVGDRIDGGATRGPNLFHSFSEFNVNDGQRVYFSNPTGIENILSRVTGSDVSDILGTLGVDGGANLFLLNPNGIIFGPNAQLDVRGSFVASTANSFTFADGSQFSATDTQAAPLLTMNAPIGLQYGAPQGNLTNQANLAVDADQSLTLHGATVLHEGELTAPGGRVQVLGDRIALLDNSRIDVSAQGGGGLVQVGGDYQGQGSLPTALRTYVAPTATLNADAIGSGNGGAVIVWADENTGFFGTISALGGTESGNGGFAEVSGLQNLLFQGSANLSAPNGVIGTLRLDSSNIVIADGTGGLDDAQVTADNIINANDDALLDYTISEASLEGVPGGASVILRASNNITIDDLTDNELTFNPGGGNIDFVANADGRNGGNFTMNAGDTIRTNGRSISISGVNLALGLIDTTPPATVPVTTVVNVDAGGVIGAVSDELQPSSFTLTVPATAPTATIADVNVVFSASHTWDSDLSVTLRSPDGQTLELFNGVGGDGDNFQDTVLDDAAPISIAGGTAPFNNGPYQPTGAGGLAVFNGSTLMPNSGWILTVTDIFPQADSGQLYQAGDATPWGTAIGTQMIVNTSVANVAPGGRITLTGTGNVSAQQLNASSFSLSGGEVTVRAGGNITVSDIYTSGFNGSGGAVRLTAGDQELRVENNPAPGNIVVQQISTFGGNGNGGLVSLDARGAINNRTNTTDINASSSTGLGGDITLNADGPLNLVDSFISSTSSSPGSGLSNILLTSTTGDIRLRGTWLDASNYNPGNGSNNTRRAGIVINTPGNVAIEDSDLYAYGIGTIDIQGGETVNLVDSVLSTETEFAADGNHRSNGAIALRTTAPNGILTLTDTQLTSSTYGADDSGNISLNSNRINLTRSQVTTTSVVLFGRDERFVTGDVGSIAINGALTLNGSLLDSSTGGSGVGGAITLDGSLRMINRSSINANTTGNGGLGGDITITAEDTQVSLADSQINLVSGRDTQAGTLTIQAGSVSLTNNSRINATVQGRGTGGTINITTTDPYNPATNTFPFHLDNSLVSTRVESTGTAAGGDITVNSAAIALFNGARIRADTLGAGDAGSITLNAIDQVTISGGNETTGLLSGLTTESRSPTSGDGGDITVNVHNASNNGTLQLDNRAFLSSGTRSNNPGGNIVIDVDRLIINSGGQIIASAEAADRQGTTGEAGSIRINARQQVSLSGVGQPITIREPDAFQGVSPDPLSGGAIAPGQSAVATNPFYANVTRPPERGEDFDYYTFSVTQAGSQGIFDIDGASFDTELFLFNQNTGEVLASNDDAFVDLNGGGSQLDSYIDYTFVDPGSYVIGIGQYDSEVVGNRVIGTPIEARASYTLRVSLENEGDVDFSSNDLNNPNSGLSSGLFAEASNAGAAGHIEISTPSLTLMQQSQISTSSEQGQGGNVTLDIDDGLSLDGGSTISASTVDGQGGTLNLTAERVSLNGASAITAGPRGRAGRGGDLNLQIQDEFLLDGMSRLESRAINGGTAGNIFLSSEWLRVRNGSEVSVSSEDGVAGNLTVNTTRLRMDNGRLTAFAGQGSNGSITINVLADSNALIELYDNSLISAEARGSADGGDVTILIPNGFVVSTLEDNSDIIARANGEGSGGDIFIRTLSIFGLRTSDRLTRFSDINASSEFGPTGTIVLSTLGIDPTRGLSELPNTVVDATSLVARSCPTQLEASDALGYFIMTGRGGLPQSPGDMMSESVLLPGLISLEPTADGGEVATTENDASAVIVEAQGWVTGPNGEVVLTAQDAGENTLPSGRSLPCEDGV